MQREYWGCMLEILLFLGGGETYIRGGYFNEASSRKKNNSGVQGRILLETWHSYKGHDRNSLHFQVLLSWPKQFTST